MSSKKKNLAVNVPSIALARNTPGRWYTDTEPNFDIPRMHAYRLSRVREQLKKHDYAGCVLYDPINIRYATGTRLNALLSMHYTVRYCFVAAEGPVVMFDFPYGMPLSEKFPTVDEVRRARTWRNMVAWPMVEENATAWADEIADLVKEHGGGNRRLAMDHCEPLAATKLEARGIKSFDGQDVLEFARSIKSEDELACISISIAVAGIGMARMHDALEPGMTENELWAILHHTNIAMGGEWIETRLLSSGGRTNPWHQECSDRMILAGELIAFDTDMIGPYGYNADVSRTFHCGPGRPNDGQRTLYQLSHQEMEHNMSLLHAGLTFREFADRAWKKPEQYRKNAYPYLAHGVGLCSEYPSCWTLPLLERRQEDGVLEAGMTISLECYVGAEGGHEGVKLEQQVLITKDGCELMSPFPYEETLLRH